MNSVERVFEVDVLGPFAEPVDECAEREVVGGDKTDGAKLEQAGQQAFGALPAIMRIRAAEHFVE